MFGFLFALCFILAALPCSGADLSHADAIQLARASKFSEAIEMLETLHRQQPLDKTITHDLIVTYCWDKKFQQACTLFEQQAPEVYPLYVQIAVLRAYRNLRRTKQAMNLVEILLTKQPDAPKLLLYKGLLLVDDHQLEPARTLLNTLGAQGRGSEYYRLSGYLHAAQENWLAALADYQQLSRLLPQDKAAVREQFSALQFARAEEAAALLLTEHPAFFTEQERAMMLVNHGAEKLRWSTDASRDFNETKLLAMQALAHQINALELLNSNQTEHNWPANVLFDLLITLRNLRQMDDVESVYQFLTDQDNIPNYVKQAVAGAVLANRHPDKSHALYQEIIDSDPGNYQAHIGLFYSLIEEENFNDAYQLIDDLRDNEPAFQASKNKKNPIYNGRYLSLIHI